MFLYVRGTYVHTNPRFHVCFGGPAVFLSGLSWNGCKGCATGVVVLASFYCAVTGPIQEAAPSTEELELTKSPPRAPEEQRSTDRSSSEPPPGRITTSKRAIQQGSIHACAYGVRSTYHCHTTFGLFFFPSSPSRDKHQRLMGAFMLPTYSFYLPSILCVDFLFVLPHLFVFLFRFSFLSVRIPPFVFCYILLLLALPTTATTNQPRFILND